MLFGHVRRRVKLNSFWGNRTVRNERSRHRLRETGKPSPHGMVFKKKVVQMKI